MNNTQKNGLYSSHNRNKTSNNIQTTMTLNHSHNQYAFPSRDDPSARKYFGSFKGSGAKKSFTSKSKNPKGKCKKRSRNKQMHIGLTSNQSKYVSKFPMSVLQEGKFFI